MAQSNLPSGWAGAIPVEFNPLTDTFKPATPAEHLAGSIARQSFLKWISQDPRVEAVKGRWLKDTGVAVVALAAQEAWARLMSIKPGISPSLFMEPETLLASLKDQPQAQQAAIAGIDADRILNKAWEENEPVLGEQLIGLLFSELEIPWPWVPVEILRAFRLSITVAYTKGLQVAMVQHMGPMVPSLRATFETQAGESLEHALQRWDLFYRAGRQQLIDAAFGPPGKKRKPTKADRPDESPPAIYAGWYYRVRVNKESINALALATGRAHHNIRYGINRAAVLLSLGATSFKPPEPVGN